MQATYSHDWAGERFQLPIARHDAHRREIIELGLRVSFARVECRGASLHLVGSHRCGGAVIVRYAVTTAIFVEASDAGEAALVVERDLAGRYENELMSVSAHAEAGDGPRCPACGSERIEHHEDVVARRHFRRVSDEGALVFDGFTDSFDDDGMRPRLWCGDCSQEWDLPEQGVDFE